MMKLQPELSLPKDLEISYPQEILDWVKTNLAGLKYVTIKKFIKRNKYDPQCCRITINEAPSVLQMPEEKAFEICEVIYKVLQYQTESADSPGEYCITLYRKMNPSGPDKPVSKHVNTGTDSTGEKESEIFDPGKIDGDVNDRQLTYIQVLQDNNACLIGLIAQVFSPVIEMNKKLLETNATLSVNNIAIKRMEYEAKANEDEQRIHLALEKEKIAASKEKLDTTLKQLNKHGALDRLISQASKKLFSSGQQEEVEVKKPPLKKITKPVQTQYIQTKSEEDEEKRKQEQDLKAIEEGLRVAPLFTHCSLLKASLDQDEEEHRYDNVKDFIKENLRESIYNDLNDLLDSENEENAKVNLASLFSNLDMEKDGSKLLMIKARMNSTQNKLIDKIMESIKPKDGEEETE